MPTPFMCHECDSPTMNKDCICDKCIEPTTADEHNKDLFNTEILAMKMLFVYLILIEK